MKHLFFISGLLFLYTQNCTAQFTQVITNTNATLAEISILDSSVVINGSTQYYGISFDNCDNLLSVTPPGILGNGNSYLNRLNEHTAYILSAFDGATHFQIYKTTDQGHNWSIVFDTTNIFINQLIMFDTLEGLAFSTFYKMYRTIDGGESWHQEAHPLIGISKASKMNDSTVCIGVNELFAISTDRGLNWNISPFVQSSPRDFCFLSDTILAIAEGVSGRRFCRSINSGDTWNNFYFPNTFNSSDVIFRDANIGYIVGWNNNNKAAILKTENFGENWEQYDTDFDSKFTDMEFLNDSIALISGTNGLLLKYNYRDHHLGFEPIYLSESQVNLFPNPTTGLQELNIQGAVNTPVQVKLLDITGKELGILFQGDIQESQKIKVDLSVYPSGVYLLSVQMDEQMQVLKTQKL